MQEDVTEAIAVSAGGNFRSGSAGTTKSQVTPPLDLSEGPRQAESPLDLSVKTRKRCADTTEYDDLIGRGSHMPEVALAKRQCLSKRDFVAYPPGHSNQSIPQEHVFLAEKHHISEMNMTKLMQQQHQQQKQPQQHQQQLIMRSKMPQGPSKYSPGMQISPTAIVQHQYELERHARQIQMAAQPQALRPHPSPSQYSPHPAPAQQAILHRRQSSPYDLPHPSAVASIPSAASQTESVALKGFFEPTQKVTVTAPQPSPVPVSRPTQHHVSMAHMMQSERALSQAARMAGLTSEHLVMDERRSAQSSFPHYPPYQRSPGSRMGPVSTPRSASGSGPVSEIELMQRHAQLQMHHQHSPGQKAYHQREQALTQSQKSPLSHAPQEVAMLMEMQKHEVSRKMQYQGKETISPYQNAIVKQVPYPEGSSRSEKLDMTSVRCMKVGQPVPLPEIHQTHPQTLERVHANPIHSDMYRRQAADAQSFMDQVSAAAAATSSVRSSASSIRYEPSSRYRPSEQFEKHHMPGGVPQTEAIQMHPSVIQRPQGYIPPRIVRRESSDCVSSNRASDRSRMYPPIAGPHTDYSEQISVRSEMAGRVSRTNYGPNKDMLSGRDVLRIQQRAAEQRNSETHVSSKHHSKTLESNIQEGSGYSERRRSLTEVNTSRTFSVESVRNTPTGERARLMSPPGRDIQRHPTPSSKEIPGPSQSPKASTYNTNSGRSITKGTSGMHKGPHFDPISEFLIRELKKPADDEINPFANRSLLQEFDRSANASPLSSSMTKIKPETETVKQFIKTEQSTTDENELREASSSKSDSSYTLPLQIAIPGHKTSTQATASTDRSSVIANASIKQETSVAAAPPACKKFMSKKERFLSQYRHDEDLNTNTVDIDKDEKVPIESAKFASMKLEKDSSHVLPPSPKMPILSPQERSRNTPLVSPAQVEQPPPNLESSSTSGCGNGQSTSEKGKEKISSLDEHLHRMILNALNKDSKETNEKDVVEAVCREFQNQGHKLFVSRQSSMTRNIPVANVAPIVHGKVMPETNEGLQDDSSKQETDEQKAETDIDDEDAKIAAVVTRSIFGDRIGLEKDEQRIEQNEQDHSDIKEQKEISAIEETNVDSPFDENSNSMRMSPGLKKLMLYRPGDTGETSSAAARSLSPHECNSENSSDSVLKSKTDGSIKRKHVEKNRNVFGALTEIVAQQCSDKCSDHEVSRSDHKHPQKDSRWSGYRNEEDGGENIEMVSDRSIFLFTCTVYCV